MNEKLSYPDEIKERVERGIGCGSQIGEGWFDLVIKLDADLTELDPNYTVDQVKEKFGALRYYIGRVETGEVFEKMHELIHTAEAKSSEICEICGKPGKIVHQDSGWVTTKCPEHANSNR